jgi:hypothetical protein
MHRVTANAVADRTAQTSAGAYSRLHAREMLRNTAVRRCSRASSGGRGDARRCGACSDVVVPSDEHVGGEQPRPKRFLLRKGGIDLDVATGAKETGAHPRGENGLTVRGDKPEAAFVPEAFPLEVAAVELQKTSATIAAHRCQLPAGALVEQKVARPPTAPTHDQHALLTDLRLCRGTEARHAQVGLDFAVTAELPLPPPGRRLLELVLKRRCGQRLLAKHMVVRGSKHPWLR